MTQQPRLSLVVQQMGRSALSAYPVDSIYQLDDAREALVNLIQGRHKHSLTRGNDSHILNPILLTGDGVSISIRVARNAQFDLLERTAK
jgi:hypothetical protein